MDTTMKDVGNKIDKSVQYGADKGKEALNRATDKAEKFADRAQDKAQGLNLSEYYDTALSATQDTVEAASDFVKKYPVSTVLGAAAVGCLIGMLARRSSRH